VFPHAEPSDPACAFRTAKMSCGFLVAPCGLPRPSGSSFLTSYWLLAQSRRLTRSLCVSVISFFPSKRRSCSRRLQSRVYFLRFSGLHARMATLSFSRSSTTAEVSGHRLKHATPRRVSTPNEAAKRATERAASSEGAVGEVAVFFRRDRWKKP
jgi:hypothetical protein